MAKQLNLDLRVQADTTDAKKQLQELSKELQAIQTTPSSLFDDTSLKKASQAASSLQKHLQACTDVNTGKLDLSKFATSLKNSGQKLETIRADLEQIGPAGSKAFLSLAQSIANADAPMLKLNGRMQEFMTTLKNTARWQISSSVIHGLMGGIQSAFYYAEDLNKSLNDIRIVTGQSKEEMAEFAIEANKSAKALSSTTLAYTDAALIFYQQGLSDELVKEYTDVTVKMANVTGDGAVEVSSYLTAIWNNFNKDGEEAAEHYADVLTALGAATASSTSEIAGGIEKFAAIADATGLSYDYAASALATLVSNTRQSEDVVGTALKTIFSRIQGVSLGETLEDGVDLNKYSEALSIIGVDVMDLNGNMRDLDDILDDTAEKWETLSRAEQMATAQTVAGVRQYNQFISLMDNWDDMEVNLDIAANADGELDKQADIFAESWDAAANHVQASLEAIYDKLINDEAMIFMYDSIAKIIDGVGGLIDGFGGIKGILLTIGSIWTRSIAKEMPKTMATLKQDLMIVTGQADKLAKSMQADMISQLEKVDVSSLTTGEDYAAGAQIQAMTEISKMKSELAAKNSTLSQSEREAYEFQIKQVEGMYGIVAAQGEQINQQQTEIANHEKIYSLQSAAASLKAKGVKKSDKDYSKQLQAEAKKIAEQVDKLKALQKQYASITSVRNKIGKQINLWDKEGADLDKLRKKLVDYVKELEASGKVNVNNKTWKELVAGCEEGAMSVEELKNKLMELEGTDSAWQSGTQSARQLEQQIDKVHNEIVEMGGDSIALEKLKKEFEEGALSVQDYHAKLEQLRKQTAMGVQHQTMMSERIMGVASAAMGVSQIISSMQSFSSVFEDDTDTLTKITTTLGMVSSITMGVTGVQKALNSVLAQRPAAQAAASAATARDTAETGANTIAHWLNVQAIMSNPYMTAVAIAACIAAAVYIGKQTAEVKKQTKAYEDNAAAAKEAVKSAREEADTNRDNLKEYSRLLKQYQETGEGKEDLDSLTRTLADAYDLEGAAIARLSGKYEDYAKVQQDAIKKQKEELEELLSKEEEAAKENTNAAVAHMEDVDLDNDGSSISGNKLTLVLDGYSGFDTEEQEAEKILQNYFTDHASGDYNDMKIKVDNIKDPQVLLDTYDKLVQARKDLEDSDIELENSGIYSDLVEWLDAMEEDVEAVRENMKEVERLQLELGKVDSVGGLLDDANQITTLKGYQAWIENARDSLEDLKYEEEEINDIISQTIEDSYNPMIDHFKEMAAVVEDVANKTHMSKDAVTDYVNGLSEEDQTFFFQIDWDRYKTEEAWDAQIEYLKTLAHQEKIEIAVDAVQNAQDTLGKGDELDEDAMKQLQTAFSDANIDFDWDKFADSSQIEQVNQMSDAVEKLTQARMDDIDALIEQRDTNIELEKQRRADIAATIEKMDNIKARMDEIKELEAEGKSHTGLREEYKSIESLYKSLQEQLADLEATEYDIDIEINLEETILDNFETKVNDILSQAERLKAAAELIGEGFIVAAEDAMELANVYPALLQNATVYEDGRIKLDQATCKAILGDNATILESNKDVADAELQNKIDLLEAEIAANNNRIQLLQDFLDGKITASELEDGLNAETAKLEAKYGDVVAENDFENAKQAAVNNEELTNTTLTNLDKIGLRANAVGEAIAAAMKGESTYSAGGATATGASLTEITAGDSAAKIDEVSSSVREEYGDEYVQSAINQLEALKEQNAANEALIAQYTAMQAELRAGTNETIEAMEDAANGLGGDKEGQKDPSREKTKTAEEDFERYHEINDVIDDLEENVKDLNREYEKLNNQTNRAFGAAKIKLMQKQRQEIDKQVAALDKQIDAQKKLLAEEKKYLSEDRAKAERAGWKFDDAGNVTNYEATLNMLKQQYNDVVNAYNSLSATAQEAFMKNLDANGNNPIQAAEENYKKALDALKQYESTREAIEDTENDIADKEKERLEKLQAQYDILLAEVQTEIELKISVDDTALDLLKDKLEDLGDSADNALDIIANINQQVNRVQTKTETYREGIGKTLDTLKDYGVSEEDLTKVKSAIADGSLGKMNTEDIQAMFSSSEIVDYGSLISDLQEYNNELLSMNEEIRAYKDQVFDTMSSAFNEYLEDLERYEAKIEHAKKMTQGYKDLITSLGKANIDKDGSLTKQINEALVSESKDALREAQATQDYAQSAFDKAKAEYEKYSTQGSPWYNEEMARKWKAQMEECEDALMAAEEKTQEALQATAEAIKTAFKDTITQIMDDLDDSLGNVSHLQQQFDQARELSEQYLDDYKKIYELSKLTRQVHKSMDETNNVKAKKALMEYQAKINKYQQDGVKMSQYELEHLQKEYELRLAEIQLEEAQNAKNQVRMTRDSEGNYGYVYTADDSAQDSARQNYEDKLYALQELNTQYITEMERLSLEIQAQWQATLDQILADESLSLEEQQARITEASNFYTQRLAYVNEQLGIAVGNNRTLYEEDWTKYSEITGYKISADEDYVDTWGETTLAVLTGAQDQEGYYQSVQIAFATAVREIENETKKYQSALEAVGLSADTLTGKIAGDVEAQKTASNEAALAAEDMSQRAQGAMQEIMDKASEFSEKWVTELEATITKNQEYVQSILDMITALSDLEAAQNVPAPSNPDLPSTPSGPGGGDSGGGDSGGGAANNADKIEGVAAAIWMDGGGTSGWYNGNDRVSRLQEKGVTAAQSYINQHGPNGDIYSKWHNKRAQLKSFYYGSFDTGGYTGEWGDSEGRLALLHSKELVLNASDTENMLAIIDMVRQISSAIDTNALSTLMSSGLTAASVNSKERDVLEQNVTITAEFPNATDKDSILDAFDNVINLAAQYANRR